MQCDLGVCMYRNNLDFCERDAEYGEVPSNCDMHKEGKCHKCHHGYVGCFQCSAQEECSM